MLSPKRRAALVVEMTNRYGTTYLTARGSYEDAHQAAITELVDTMLAREEARVTPLVEAGVRLYEQLPPAWWLAIAWRKALADYHASQSDPEPEPPTLAQAVEALLVDMSVPDHYSESGCTTWTGVRLQELSAVKAALAREQGRAK
jgi:hypothetical protein